MVFFVLFSFFSLPAYISFTFVDQSDCIAEGCSMVKRHTFIKLYIYVCKYIIVCWAWNSWGTCTEWDLKSILHGGSHSLLLGSLFTTFQSWRWVSGRVSRFKTGYYFHSTSSHRKVDVKLTGERIILCQYMDTWYFHTWFPWKVRWTFTETHKYKKNEKNEKNKFTAKYSVVSFKVFILVELI